MTNDVLNRVMYGVWIQNKGWLKVDNNGYVDCYSDVNRDVVEDTAARFHGEVRYIDNSLFRLEQQILDQEARDEEQRRAAADNPPMKWRSLWHTFKTWFVSLSRR